MDKHIQTIIKKARLKMFRKDIGLILFGACSYKFNWKVVDLPETIEGCVMFDIKTKQVEDGTIYINQNYINKDDYNHNNLIALIIHEILHILQKHGIRSGSRDFKFWNFACDHVVDRDLKSIGLEPYENRFNIIPELHKENPKCTAEEAYKWIMEKNSQFQLSENGDGNNVNENNNNIQSFTIKDEKSGDEYDIVVTSEKRLSQEDKEKIKQKTEQFVSEARAQNQIMKEKGNGSNSIQQYLDKLLKVEINWKDLLEKAIKNSVILKPNNRSWRKIHPYYQLHGMTIPGRSMEEEKENVGLLVVLVDTSASISKKELKQFAYVLNKSIQYFETVQLITHDTDVKQNIKFKKDEHNKFYEFLKNQGFTGRGGTSHIDCFNIIEKDIWNEKEKRDVLSMIVSLTDGYSDIERIIDNYNWVKNKTPLVFMSTSNWTFKDEEKFENIHTITIK